MHLNDTVMLMRSGLGNSGNGLIPVLHLHACLDCLTSMYPSPLKGINSAVLSNS